MSEQPAPSERSSSGEKLKTLIFQGIIGAIALAGTTAIPLMIKRILEPPVTPPAVTTEATSTINPSELQPDTTPVVEQQSNDKGKPKKEKD